MAVIPKIVPLFKTTISAKVSATATEFYLTSINDYKGNELSGIYGIIVDKGTTVAEFMIGTITSDKKFTVIKRGLDPITLAEDSTLKFAHERGSVVKITDHPILAIMQAMITGSEALPNPLRYADGVQALTDQELITRKQLAEAAFAGAPSASQVSYGLVKLSKNPDTGEDSIAASVDDPRIPTQDENNALAGSETPNAVNKFVTESTIAHMADSIQDFVAGEDIDGSSTPIPVNLDPITGKVYKTRANDQLDKFRLGFVGFAISTGLTGGLVKVQISGILKKFTGLTPFTEYFIQDTIGTIGTTKGTISATKVGYTLSPTDMLVYSQKRSVVMQISIAASATPVVLNHALGVKPRKIAISSFCSKTTSTHGVTGHCRGVWEDGIQGCVGVTSGSEGIGNFTVANSSESVLFGIYEYAYPPKLVYGSITDVSANTITITFGSFLNSARVLLSIELEA